MVAKRGRVYQIVAEQSEPRDRPEAEIVGYRDVLDTIHGGYDAIPLSNGVVKQLLKQRKALGHIQSYGR